MSIHHICWSQSCYSTYYLSIGYQRLSHMTKPKSQDKGHFTTRPHMASQSWEHSKNTWTKVLIGWGHESRNHHQFRIQPNLDVTFANYFFPFFSLIFLVIGWWIVDGHWTAPTVSIILKCHKRYKNLQQYK